MVNINLDTVITKSLKIQSILDYPAIKMDKHPLIIYLHGAGERDFDFEFMRECSIRNQINEKLGFAILTPHCPPGEIWEPDIIAALVREAINFGNIDHKRIYLTGISMGGRGTWSTATSYPNLFAAIMPLCGYSLYLKAEKIKHLPALCFHGKNDNVVPIEESEKMIGAMRAYGNKSANLIKLKDGHGLSWIYNCKDPYKWLLSYENLALSE